ncbi:MAG: hypothetical protein GXX84_07670 [Acidobacteria bacterium]|nr:hypothetical protein [Acidobacteriota bacterium]
METQPVPDAPTTDEQAGTLMTFTACFAGACVPGLGHALLGKWDRAFVFFCSIAIMLTLGIQLQGRLYGPDFVDFFSALKFIAEAGSGLLFWIPWLSGMGNPDPTAYTYDYANLFMYVAGLLNMLVVVDVFDIALGRKQ